MCVACKSEKATVFEKITEENINKEIPFVIKEATEKKNLEISIEKKRLLFKKLNKLTDIACILSFAIFIFLLFNPFWYYVASTIIFSILGLFLSCLCILFKSFYLKSGFLLDKKAKIISIGYIIAACVLTIMLLIGFISLFC